MRKIAIVTANLTVEHEKKLAEYLGERNYGSFWHRMQNCWLLTCDESLSISQLCDEIMELIPEARFFVLEVSRWQSFIPLDWTEWLTKHWDASPQATDKSK